MNMDKDYALPRERTDRRSPLSEQRVRSTDHTPIYPWAFGVLCLFVAVMNHVRWTEKVVEIEENHALEIAAKVATIGALLPPPPVCREYKIHMQLGTVTHCIRKPAML